MSLQTILSHITPLQWVLIFLPFAGILIRVLLNWGKPRRPPTFRQGCISGFVLGIIIGMMIGMGIALYTQLVSLRYK